MKKMLDAMAFADAGEYLTGREKSRVLSKKSGPVNLAPATPERAAARASSNARRVAVYMGSELPAEVMDYVIETCARLRHELTVLTFQSDSAGKALLQPYQQTLAAAGVDFEMGFDVVEQVLQGDVTGEQRVPVRVGKALIDILVGNSLQRFERCCVGFRQD